MIGYLETDDCDAARQRMEQTGVNARWQAQMAPFFADAGTSAPTRVRLLAAELGEFGIRVNGINPDAVVRGSGIFAGGWGAQRAAVYGVPESELGAFYAQRTLLKREVLPEHVAAAVFVLTAGELPVTTGLHIPVDPGVAAFLR